MLELPSQSTDQLNQLRTSDYKLLIADALKNNTQQFPSTDEQNW